MENLTQDRLTNFVPNGEYRALKDVALELCKILYDAIAEAGEEGIPSGHLYAQLCGHMGLNLYQHLIGTLKKHGFVKESHFVLTAHRPEPS